MGRFYFLLICIVFQSSLLMAQDVLTKDNAPKSALRMLNKALSPKLVNAPDKQYLAFEKLIAKYPTFIEAYENKAYALYKNGNQAEAKRLLEKSILLNPDYKPKKHLILANYCLELEDLECEKVSLNNFLKYGESSKLADKILERLQSIQDRESIMEDYQNITLEKLSKNINSDEYAEYKPFLSLDGTELIFTRRVHGQEDFYVSHLKDTVWSEAKPIIELNTEGNEGAHAISLDGKWMIYTRCDVPNRYKSCDLYISRKKNGKWEEANYMDICNTEAWESQASFSPDGNSIYFSSARSGNRDIYYITRVENKWSEVQNLGNIINTDGNEESPFIHPDGRSLYFMSNAHAGLGGMDLFLSKMQSDGKWSKPINLGSAINSPKDEGGLFVDRAGEYAYFSKTEKKGNELDSDIYRFLLPAAFKPEPINYVRIKVYDGISKKAISANLSLKNQLDNTVRNITIPIDGDDVIIDAKANYSVTVEKAKYAFHSERISITEETDKFQPYAYNIFLYPLTSEIKMDTLPPISLRNISFESGKYDLLADSYAELGNLINILNENSTTRILLNGHTDNIGSESENLILSRQRANSVKQYLISKGIKEARIDILAFGESQPIVDNDTALNRSINRRIEFQIINP